MTPSTPDELAERMEQFELVSRSALDGVWTELGGHNVPLAEFGAAVVRRELLTRYQFDRLMRGEHDGFLYGRAKILYQVGAGSFSRVFRAIHADTGRVLAVKVLRNRFATDPDKGKSFQREGEMGKRLRHAHIVQIEDVGRENGTSYITMEFVEGQTLRELVRVRELCDGAAVHDKDRIAGDDGVEAVRDDEEVRARKCGANRRLDARVGVGVERGGGLVHDDDARAAEEDAREAEKLALALREVLAKLGDGRVEAAGQGAHLAREAHGLECAPERRVGRRH